MTLIDFSFQCDFSCCDSTQQRSLNRLGFVYELAKYACGKGKDSDSPDKITPPLRVEAQHFETQ